LNRVSRNNQNPEKMNDSGYIKPSMCFGFFKPTYLDECPKNGHENGGFAFQVTSRIISPDNSLAAKVLCMIGEE